MALVAKVARGLGVASSKCWQESVEEVQDNFGGFGQGLGGSPDLGVYLEVDAYNRVGGLRFGDIWKKDEGEVHVREVLSGLASSMVSGFSRGERGGAATSRKATSPECAFLFKLFSFLMPLI